MAETCDDPIDLEHLTNELEKFDKMLKESDDSDSAAESGMDSSNIDLSSGTPTFLEKYLLSVAKTGNPLVPWKAVKTYIRHKIDSILTNFYEKYGIEDIYSQNLPLFNYIPAKEKLLQHFDTFTGAPFTIQRLCELLLEPGRHYKRTDRLLRAFEKNILVVSTTGRLSDDCSDPQQRSLLFNSLQMTTFRAFRPPLPDHGDKYSEKRWKRRKSIHCWSPEEEEKSLDYSNMDEENPMWEKGPLVYSASSVHSSVTEKFHLDCSITGGNSPKRDEPSLEYLSNFYSGKTRKKRTCKYFSSGGNSPTREMLPLECSATPDNSSVRENQPVKYSATVGKSPPIRRKRPLEYSSSGVDSPWPKACKRHKRCHSDNPIKFIIPQASADDVELKAGTAGGTMRGGLIGGQHLNGGDDSGLLEEDEASFEDECLKHDPEDDDIDEEELEDELRPRFAGAGGGGGLDSYSLAVSSVLSIRRKRKEQHHKQHQQRSKRMRLEKQQQQQQRDAVKERKHHEGEDEDDEGEEEEEDEEEEEEQGGSKTAATGSPLQQEARSRLLTTAKTCGKQKRHSDRDEVKSPLEETSSDEETMSVDTPVGTVAPESKSSEETASAQTAPKDDSADDDSDADSTELKKKELDAVQKTEEAPAGPKVTEEDNTMETEESSAEAVVGVDTKSHGDGPPASELSPMSENQQSASETSASDTNEATESADESRAGESGVASAKGGNVEETSPKREQPEDGEPQAHNGVPRAESDDSEGVAPVESGQTSGQDRTPDDRGCSKRDGGTEQLG